MAPTARADPLRRHEGRPGHYVVSGAALGVAGDWTVEIVARVSDFDEHPATLEVPIE